MIHREKIRLICEMHFIFGKSLRWISKHYGIHRNTVSKYVTAFEVFCENTMKLRILNINEVNDWSSLIIDFLAQPSIKEEVRKKRKLNNNIVEFIIDQWEEYIESIEPGKPVKRTVLYERLSDSKKRKNLRRGKKIILIHFNISYSTFCDVIRKYEQRRKG